jgi:CheY-like chemotaxis protein
MAFVSDITARRETRRLLVANNEDLARALARAHEASEHKSRFLASMSHELRTPLNAIIGFTEIIHDGRAGEINEMQEEFLGDSLGSARQLLALINDILDLEKVAAGRRELTLERFDVHQLIRETVQEVGVTAAANEVRVVAELAESVRWVFLDRQKTKQVLLNLASNAVKFTPDGGLVTVRARAAGSERWILEVEDTGIGISEEDQTRLFREFEQLDTLPAKSFKGTGLGLVLAKSMVEAQGGTIAVVSRVGVGSTFSAMLPLTLERRRSRDSRVEDDPGGPLNSTAAIIEETRTGEPVSDAAQALHPKEGETAPAVPAEPGPGVAPSGYGRRVLILDDDPNVQKLAKLALRDAGLEAVSCMDGESGLRELTHSLPTAMIVDLMMPKLDGFNFLSRLQQIPSASTVPVLVWTNLDLSEEEMAALQLVTRQVIYKRDGGIDRVIQELEKRMKEPAAKGTYQ